LDLADAVTVPSVSHLLHFNELQVEFSRAGLWDYLTALEHAIREGLEVSTANHEYTWSGLAYLDHLEVVREVSAELDELVLHLTGQRVVRSHGLAVLLEDMDLSWVRELNIGVLPSISSKLLGYSLAPGKLGLLYHGLSGGKVLICSELTRLVLQSLGHLTFFHVLGQLAHQELLATTTRAIDLQHLHYVNDLLVDLRPLHALVALRTPHSALSSDATTAQEDLAVQVATFPSV